MNAKIYDYLAFIYGDDMATALQPRLTALLDAYKERMPSATQQHYFDEGDAILITYGDMVQAEGERPLLTLYHFLKEQVGGLIRGVHLLPFFPYSSDDGFSVIDYNQVDPALGNWEDVEAFGQTFRLMFDAVINHISQYSDWFQSYLHGETPYINYFVEVDPTTDLTAVFRPRALPLLTQVNTSRGVKHVWTTFSADQIDLNYASPDLLLEILSVLLNYVAHGAELIRLDAIAYMWKEAGTDCIHLAQTHALIQLMRAVLDEIAPHVVLITETNVPHKENVSYFGDGRNEAQMVYNFSLPPLTLHAFHSGNAMILSQWAATLDTPSDEVTFFNFLASHDGIGLTPARGLLADSEVSAMAQRVEALGGYVSYKNNPDGSQSAYELNINYLDALGDPANPNEPTSLKAKRFLAAQAIMLALRGVPGIYFHSLFGSQSWPEGVQKTGRARTINRQKLEIERLTDELTQPDSLRRLVFAGWSNMLQMRAASIAFHPNGGQKILDLHPALFVVLRTSPGNETAVLCVQNVSNQIVEVELPVGQFIDLLADTAVAYAGSIALSPYQVLWLEHKTV